MPVRSLLFYLGFLSRCHFALFVSYISRLLFFFFFCRVDFPQLFHLFQRYLGIMTGDNNAPPWETHRWCHCFTAITLCSQHSQSQSTKVVHCQFKFVTSVSYRTWTAFYFNPTIQPILLPMWTPSPFFYGTSSDFLRYGSNNNYYDH